MSPSAVPPIGKRIRQERMRKGISARGLARDIGVSPSLISQIETDKSQPSVSTLYAITTALGISVEDIFAATETDDAATDVTELDGDVRALVGAGSVMPVSGGAAGTAAGVVAALQVLGANRRRVGPVVRPAQREVLTLDSGVSWELLGQVPDAHTEFLRITYQPGGSSSSSGLLMRHSGTEFGYVISGELILTLGFDEHHMTAGDSCSFDSTTPHAYRNDGVEPAIGIWFVLERPA